jgi:hypothetical protein
LVDPGLSIQFDTFFFEKTRGSLELTCGRDLRLENQIMKGYFDANTNRQQSVI